MSAADRLLSGRRLIRSLPGPFHEQAYLLLRAWCPANQIRGCVFFRAPGLHLGTVDGTWGNGETENYKYSRFPASFFFAYVLAESLIGASLVFSLPTLGFLSHFSLLLFYLPFTFLSYPREDG